MSEVRQCAHCEGTGTCMKAVAHSDLHMHGKGRFNCQTCGGGIHGGITKEGKPAGGYQFCCKAQLSSMRGFRMGHLRSPEILNCATKHVVEGGVAIPTYPSLMLGMAG